MRVKSKRVVLEVGRKLEIIDKMQSGFHASQLALECGVGIQTVRGIYKNKDSLVEYAVSSSSSGSVVRRKALKKSKFKELDARLSE
jgi:hypothetical protein